jgi:lipopolysaccharide export system protein LptA
MTLWQRRLRFIVAIFGLVLAAVVFLAIRRREPSGPPASPARLDPRAQTETDKGVIRSIKGSKSDYRVAFEHAFSYADGVNKLRGVTINVEDRGSRSFILTAREAEVGPKNAWMNVNGDVKLVTSDGLTARTDQASFTDQEGIVRAPGKVTFERNRMKGSGIGMTYDKTRDVLWLLDQAEMTVAPDEKGGGAVAISSGAAGIARGDKYMKFQRAVSIVRDGRVINSDDATAYVSDDEKHITALELRGHSRITPQPAGPGSLQQMDAADMNLTYAQNSDLLEQAVLSGNSAVQLMGENGARGSRIAADSLDMKIGPDGSTLTLLMARNNVEAAFAAQRDQPSRVVRSVSLDAKGEPGRGLTSATFNTNVEFRETTTATPPVQRVVRARLLEAVLDPATAAIQEGKFSGAVRFEEGQMTATAAIARYSVTEGSVDLSGLEGVDRPVVADEQIRVEARSILLKPEGRHMVAVNDVRSTMQPARKKPAAGTSAAPSESRMPGLLQQDQPVSVTADKLEYDGDKSTAVYTGNGRLWQGDTSINANSLSLDNTKGDLTAAGSVRSFWTAVEKAKAAGTAAPQPAPEGTAAKAAKTETLASADEMRYEDSARRATYSGNAHVVGTQGDVTAVKIELFLLKDSNDLERVEAYENVKVKIDKRTSTGTRMTYFSADERYVMNGSPVRILDECGSETVGRVVTFFKSTDTAIVDGVQTRAKTTRTSGKCQ